MKLADNRWVESIWPHPSADDDKYTRGVVGVVAGSATYPGAAVLTTSAALYSGAGMVRYVGPRRAQDLVLQHRPEVVAYDAATAARHLPHASAWVVGPGVAHDAGQDAAIMATFAANAPLVVDAGALGLYVTHQRESPGPLAASQVLLTPHARELAQVLAALGHAVTVAHISADRLTHAQLVADLLHATVLLKGSQTVVVSPDHEPVVLPEAPASLATAGTGDVLAGVAGMLLAAGLPAADAGVAASWIHAQAARAAGSGGPSPALSVAAALAGVISRLRG